MSNVLGVYLERMGSPSKSLQTSTFLGRYDLKLANNYILLHVLNCMACITCIDGVSGRVVEEGFIWVGTVQCRIRIEHLVLVQANYTCCLAFEILLRKAPLV